MDIVIRLAEQVGALKSNLKETSASSAKECERLLEVNDQLTERNTGLQHEVRVLSIELQATQRDFEHYRDVQMTELVEPNQQSSPSGACANIPREKRESMVSLPVKKPQFQLQPIRTGQLVDIEEPFECPQCKRTFPENEVNKFLSHTTTCKRGWGP